MTYDDGSEHIECQNELNVTYSSLQNDILLSFLDYIDEIYGSYGYYILQSDQWII